MVLRNLTFSATQQSPAPPQPTSKLDTEKNSRGDGGQAITHLGTKARSVPTANHNTLEAATRLNYADETDNVVESIETMQEVSIALESDEQRAIILDPADSERQFWADPAGRLQREVWRPGDGDGDKAADYYEKPGPRASLEKRWRFYQSRTGADPIKRDVNEPPKYVILDDKAAYECLASDIPRQHLGRYWDHDFSSAGLVRSRRPHRGRGAISDIDAYGDDKYHFALIGIKGDKYYFTGEKDYTPIVYRTADPKLAIDVFKPPKRVQPPSQKKALPSNKHGHNQFTPKDQLVRLGAPHKGSSWMRYSKRINPFLTREKTPPLRSHGGMSTLHARDPAEATALSGVRKQRLSANVRPAAEDHDVETASESERPLKKQRVRSKASLFEEEEYDDELEGYSERHVAGGEESRNSDAEHISGHSTLFNSEVQEADAAGLNRTKLAEKPNFFERIAAQQNTANEDPDVMNAGGALAGTCDSGTYASRLEVELAAARRTIEALEDDLTMARRANEEQACQMTESRKSWDEAKSMIDRQAGEIIELKGKLGITDSHYTL